MSYFLSKERRIRLLVDLTDMRMPRDVALEWASVPEEQVDVYLGSMTGKLHRHVGKLIIEADPRKHNELRASIGAEILVISMYSMEIVDRFDNKAGKPLAVVH